jgi:hypothetical protein
VSGCNVPDHPFRATLCQRTVIVLSIEHIVTYPTSNLAMPHKFLKLHAIKIYTHKILAEALYIKHKHTNTSVNTQIHTKIIVNIYMQHIQEIPIKVNTVITAHMITHKNKHINNNAACKFYHTIGTYLGKNVTNYVQTFHEPPNLRPHYSSLSTLSHP